MGKNKVFNLEEWLLENLKTVQYRKEYFVGNTATKILLFYLGFLIIGFPLLIEFLHFNENLVYCFFVLSSIIGLMFYHNKKDSLIYQEEIAKMELDKFYLDKKIKDYQEKIEKMRLDKFYLDQEIKKYLVLRLIKILTI